MRINSTPSTNAQPSPTSVPQAPDAAAAPQLAQDSYTPRAKVATGGVQSFWEGHLPGWARFGILEAKSLVVRPWDFLVHQIHPPAAPANPTAPAGRAQATWQAIQTHLGVPGQSGMFLKQPGSLLPADVWPHGQGIAATLDIAQLTGNYQAVDSAMKGLSFYNLHGAYAPGVFSGPTSKRYFDDNQWIGLDFMQAYNQTGNQAYLKQAESLFKFIQTGMSQQGGVYWDENRRGRNTCSNAPAAEYALRLYMATKDPQYLQFAETCQKFLDSQMRSPQGLYYDNVSNQGSVDKSIYTYNQGTPIGTDVLFYRITGDKKYLDAATQTANAALDYFSQNDRLWKSPPVFNAIFFRNLLALDAVDPNPRYRQALSDYTNRLWTQARDPKTGLFDQGGLGHYDGPGGYIDQSAIAQLFALQDWPKDQLLNIS